MRRVQQCPQPYAPLPTTSGILNAASYRSAMTPGMIFTLFGRRLGPASLVTAQLEDGRFPTQLGGIRVLLDGIPAPLIFTSEGQLSGVIPYGMATPLATVEVEGPGGRSAPRTSNLSPAAPGVFSLDSSGAGQGAILNQDGTLNGPSNPAERGSIIIFFATGAGAMYPPAHDGELAREPLSVPVLDASVRIGPHAAEVLYAGAAPGLISGLLQVNARVPTRNPTLHGAQTIELNVGGWRTLPTQVTVSIAE